MRLSVTCVITLSPQEGYIRLPGYRNYGEFRLEGPTRLKPGTIPALTPFTCTFYNNGFILQFFPFLRQGGFSVNGQGELPI
jgi:hypothetical protein